ncbi:MAG TPA: biotin--[acetyl-CoA-carboxylase] ligase [Lachnospiraceae bacterium]|nr:biotin--[acetyl-CoA-carboxylase] ligase [Lachnospiraceae bacterium]
MRKLPDVFTQNELLSCIHTQWAGSNLLFYDSIDSTNLKAKLLAEEGAPNGTLVVAGEQTAGRGRKGREWVSPRNVNVYFTLLLRPSFQPDLASMLTLVMALAVKSAVEDVCGNIAQIKWPNDIVMNRKKVTGILTEMSLQGEDIQYVVIGVGMNVKKQSFSQDLHNKATSMEAEAGKEISRALLLHKVMEYFETDYSLFLENMNLSLLLEKYNHSLVNLNREVRVLDPAGEYTGTALGINKKGELLVKMPDHTIKEVYAGEVSVRGIYGYV